LGIWTGTYIEEADRRVLERDPNTATFVLREGDRVDALLIARVDPIVTEGIDADVCELAEMPSCSKQAGIILLVSTRKGAGSKMVRAFEQWAKEIEVDAIYVTSAPGAKGFWERMGYTFMDEDDAVKLRSD